MQPQPSCRTLPARTLETSTGAASVPFLRLSSPATPTLRRGPTKPSGRGGLVSASPSRPGALTTARPRTPSEHPLNPASQDVPALSADITLTLIRQINTAFNIRGAALQSTPLNSVSRVKGRQAGIILAVAIKKKNKKEEERGVWREVISRCLKQRWSCLDGVCDGERQAWARASSPLLWLHAHGRGALLRHGLSRGPQDTAP